MTETQQSERREKEVAEHSSLFMTALDVDDMIARLLVSEGFQQVEEVAFVPATELEAIEGFDAGIAAELQNRARTFVTAKEEDLDKRLAPLKIADDLATFGDLTKAQLVALGEAKITTLEDFAELATDELLEDDDAIWKECPIKAEKASELIMQAREACGWFKDLEQQDENEETKANETDKAEA